MEEPITKKAVNVLVREADPRVSSSLLTNTTQRNVLQSVLRAYKNIMGGLWVGGTVTLYETKLVFQPNGMNQAFHVNDCFREMSLSEIREVHVRLGIVTKIIDIVTTKGTLSMRCFGAKHFAEKIRTQSIVMDRKRLMSLR